MIFTKQPNDFTPILDYYSRTDFSDDDVLNKEEHNKEKLQEN